MRDVPADWYDGFFEQSEWIDEIVPTIDDERTEREANFIVEQLALEPGEHVLDLACGHGRISRALAARGHRVTGLDLSPRSLDVARRLAEEQGVEVEWVHADMRDVPPGPFDAIVNVFTAFGYFEDEAENQRVLEGVARALRPGGRFLIDTINLLGLASRYRERAWDELPSGVLNVQEHRYDVLRGRNESVWTFIRPDGSRAELVHSLRTYTPHELAAMLEAAGLRVDGSWGGFDGSELSMQSWRLILRAVKG